MIEALVVDCVGFGGQGVGVTPHRVESVLTLLASLVPTKKHIQVVKKWHKVLEESSAASCIPGATGLFSDRQSCPPLAYRQRLCHYFDGSLDTHEPPDSVRRDPT